MTKKTTTFPFTRVDNQKESTTTSKKMFFKNDSSINYGFSTADPFIYFLKEQFDRHLFGMKIFQKK